MTSLKEKFKEDPNFDEERSIPRHLLTCEACQENWRRIKNARIAIRAMTEMTDSSGDAETDLMDLIVNLMHLSYCEGWDFENLLTHAKDHYEEEAHGGSEHGV